jgi:ribosomal protein S18 acetylase RimI-like enzyme
MSTHVIQHELPCFKRYRMELDLTLPLPPVPAIPADCRWVAWDDALLPAHAEVKARCFANEIDRFVFPNLGSVEGCLRLMREIRGKLGFRPQATWLIAQGNEFVGTIQGIAERIGIGAIQNVGVVDGHRGHGLGTALLVRALHGFRTTGLSLARLDVTSTNEEAIRLYRKLGFRFKKTLYKVADPLALVAAQDWCV